MGAAGCAQPEHARSEWAGQECEEESGPPAYERDCHSGAYGHPSIWVPRHVPAPPTLIKRKPKSLMEITPMTWEAQRAAVREAARFMDGRSLKGKWVLEERTVRTVMYFDEQKGYGFIEEDEMFDEIFVNRRSVEQLAEPNWMHNLRDGE